MVLVIVVARTILAKFEGGLFPLQRGGLTVLQ